MTLTERINRAIHTLSRSYLLLTNEKAKCMCAGELASLRVVKQWIAEEQDAKKKKRLVSKNRARRKNRSAAR